MNLTTIERRAIFAGTYTALKRPTKPAVTTGQTQVLSWTRGGKQIVDRSTGATVDVPRKPTVWIEFTKEPYLKDGRWVVEFEGHDDREPTRLLSSTPSGVKREAGLRTRQRDPDHVPKRGEETEVWNPESERGYSGSGRTAIDPAEGVDDDTLNEFSARAKDNFATHRSEQEAENKELREEARRKRERAVRDRLREALAKLEPEAQVALLASMEQQIERARLLSA